jgi:post-segregation antitoxin (ccd killing protein)
MRNKQTKAKGGPSTAPQERARQNLTVQIDGELIERARDAVFHTPGLTLAGLVQSALAEALKRLENKRGEPYPKRPAAIRVGRPVR